MQENIINYNQRRTLSGSDVLNNDLDVRDTIKKIRENTPESEQIKKDFLDKCIDFISRIAKKNIGKGVEYWDLIGMGCIGLNRAIDQYDLDGKEAFRIYASWKIRREMFLGIYDELETIRKPYHIRTKILKVQKMQKRLKTKTSVMPCNKEVADALGMTEQEVAEAIYDNHDVVSLSEVLGEGVCEDYGSFDGETADYTWDEVLKNACKQDLLEAISQLPKKEGLVLKMRSGIGTSHPMTLDEIAKLPEFGVSRERIRQIEVKALRLLRRPGKIRCIRSYAV